MDKDRIMNLLRNIAKDYKVVTDGSMLECAIESDDIPDEVQESEKTFNDKLMMVSEAIGDRAREEIFESAMVMLTKHETYAFQKGFEYALKLADII